MSATAKQHATSSATVLLVDGDVVARLVIAEYLRHCGYKVIEAATTEEALVVFERSPVEIDVLLADANASGSMNGFELAQWVRRHRSSVDVLLVGTVNAAAGAARDICDEGPLRKPYEPQALLDRIKLLKAARAARLKK